MVCEVCGRDLQPLERACPTCGPAHYVLKAQPGDYRITGYPMGTLVEGPPDSTEGRRVDSRPASGGRSYSSTDPTGAFTADLSGPLVRGRHGEERVLKVLTQALRARGEEVSSLVGGRDDRGEDGLLSIGGQTVRIQIVSMPVDPTVWKELSMDDAASREGTTDDAVRMVRDALVHKKDKAAGTLLALDAAHVGAIFGPRLVAAYQAAYGDPEEEFSLVEAWIIGPSARSSVRLGLRRPPHLLSNCARADRRLAIARRGRSPRVLGAFLCAQLST